MLLAQVLLRVHWRRDETRRSGPRRRRRGADHRRGLTLHLDATVTVLDLDLGERVIREKRGKFPHQPRVDAHRDAFIPLGGLGHPKSPFY
jgi:hypothetical protein